MQREILFRGKRLDNGQFIEGSLTVDCHGNCCIYRPLNVPIGGGFQYFDVDPETVGQLTGMTDKNGTKIFEGDILNEPFQGREKLYQVFWSEDYFSFRVKTVNFEYYLDEMVQYRCEVIGNIYDNKELLK